MIFQHTHQLVAAGAKTQTRRLVDAERDEVRMSGDRIVAVIRYAKPDWSGVAIKPRTLYEVGRTYAVQPGRGKPSVARVRLTEIRRDRLWDISGEDAIAEGFAPRECARVFDEAAEGHLLRGAAYLEDEDGNEDGETYCVECAERLAKARKMTPRSWGGTPETDGPAYCEECGVTLDVSLTAYGIERELYLECECPEDRRRYPVRGRDARIAREIASGVGDLRERHHGRLAQIGFATRWDLIHGKGAWAKNPSVYALTFLPSGARA